MMCRISLIIGSFLLSACSVYPQYGNGMMQGGQGMMNGDRVRTAANQPDGFLPGFSQDVSALPEAKPSEPIEVHDGEMIRLDPMMVRKEINGRDVAMYGYNGEIPGPVLKASQGASFTVSVTNKIDLPTTVHWHGVRLENSNDGVEGVTQPMIAPGDSYTYTVKVPDEGMYWYHTHVREDVQQPMGLYGAILVTPVVDGSYTPADEEHSIILNDLLVNDEGTPVPYGSQNPDHTLMGRFGNLFLVNGQMPEPSDVALGSVVRYSILNASNTRTYRIVKPKDGMLKIIGGDSGRYEQEFFADTFIVSPSERVIAEIYYFDEAVSRGSRTDTTVTIVEAGPLSNPVPVVTAKIAGGVAGESQLESFKTLRKNADVIRSIDPFRNAFGKEPDHTIVLEMGMMGGGRMRGHGEMMGRVPKDGIEWEDAPGMMDMMGSMMKWRMVDKETGSANEDLLYTARVGDQVKFRIVNPSDSPHPMQHPVHFHGQRFLVLSDNGVPMTNHVWKDTVLVPAGHTIDILMDMSNPGDWMFHCHIAEHLGNGMMGMLRVLP